MATRTWLDASGDWGSTSNWSGGAVPVSNDDVVINYGVRDITTNLNQSAVSLNSLTITAGYRGNIQDSSGGPLQIGVNGAAPTAFNVAVGGNAIRWKGTATVPINVASTGAGVFYIASASVLTGSGSLSLCCGSNGQVVIASGCTITRGILTSGIGITCDSNPVASSSYPVQAFGGNHVFTGNMAGCYLEVMNGTFSAVNQPTNYSTTTVTSVKVLAGGTYVNDQGATVTTCYAQNGGTLRPGSQISYTISTLELAAGANVTYNNPYAGITVTTTNKRGLF